MTITYDFDDEEFEYEIAYEDVRDAVVDILKKCDKEQLIGIITEADETYEEAYLSLMTDEELQQIILTEFDLDMLEDIFQEDLYSYFEDEASEAYADACADEKDRRDGYDWYK